MRFPLIVLVVFAHSLSASFHHIAFSADKWNLYYLFSEMISHNVCKIAVCWFFVFAGYLFFFNVPKEGINYKWLSEKWKRRAYTLLIPYLFWNILSVVVTYIKTNLFSRLGIPQSDPVSVLFSGNNGPLFWFLTGPENFPLWFMRDLIIMCLSSPVVYYIFKKLPRIGGITVLLILFLLPVEAPVLTWRGYFFFSLGAFLGIQRINILDFCEKVKWAAAIMAIVLLLISTFFNDASFHSWLLRIFYPFGMISFMNIINSLIDKKERCEKLCRLSATVFFIYASHAILILGWTKGLMLRIFGNSLIGNWMRYLLVPITVLGICMALYYLLNKMMPQALAFVCGGRSKR